jgi:hypothetical protein
MAAEPDVGVDGLRIYDRLAPIELVQRRLERDRVTGAELRPVVSPTRTGLKHMYRVRQWGVFVDGSLAFVLHLRRDGRIQKSGACGWEPVAGDNPPQP